MYPSIEHKVRFSKDVHLCVTIEFGTWHTMLNVLRLVHTRIFIDNYNAFNVYCRELAPGYVN